MNLSKVIVGTMMLFSLSAFGVNGNNHNCVYSNDKGDAYTIQIYNDAKGMPQNVLIFDEAKRRVLFSDIKSGLVAVPPESGKSLPSNVFQITAQKGNDHLQIIYIPVNEPEQPIQLGPDLPPFSVLVMGEVPEVGFPPKGSLSDLEISQTFNCTYF